MLARWVDRGTSANLDSMAAPIGGWNTRDPIAQMPQKDAARLRNLIADTNGVRLRNGYTELCATGSSYVDFLKTFDTPFGPRLLAASSRALYDITSGSASTIRSGFARDDWSAAIMNGRMGLVNGGDDPIFLVYGPVSGITVQNMTLTGPVTPEAMRVIHIYKSRSSFATGDEPAFWYSEVNALGGTLTKFPIDRVSASGGNVIEVSSWTVDGGSGPDDYFVLFLNTGEANVYQGDDPGDPDFWALVGRYQAGKVVTTTQFAGSIHAITEVDYNTFPLDFQNQGLRPPSKLSGAAKQAVKQKGGLDRWQMIFVPNLGLRIVNVPQSVSTYHQHVLNLNNGAPSLWTDLNATRWEVFKGELYFGDTAGKVNRYEGTSDNGAAISWEMVTAPNRLGSDFEKNILEYRSIVSGEGSLTEATGIGYDYNAPDFIQEMTTEAIGTPWNTSPWNTSNWSEGPQTKNEWFSGTGSGQAVQYYSRGSVKGFTPIWHSIDFLFELSDVH